MSCCRVSPSYVLDFFSSSTATVASLGSVFVVAIQYPDGEDFLQHCKWENGGRNTAIRAGLPTGRRGGFCPSRLWVGARPASWKPWFILDHMIRTHRAFDGSRVTLLIFDLDGTLIDSRLDLVHSVNAMLRRLARPELPGDVIASYVGDGAPMLVRRALGDPDDQELVQSAVDYFMAYYREHKLDHTHVYEGIRETLEVLQQGTNGTPRQMAVLSNKPVGPS